MSGSDIKEACRDAAMVPVREYMREQRALGTDMSGVTHEGVRGIRTEDFFGRKGGDMILKDNHERMVRRESRKNVVQSVETSENEYESVDETLDRILSQD